MVKTFAALTSRARAAGVKALLAAAAVLPAQAASADTLKYDGAWFGNYAGIYAVHDTSPTNFSVTAYAGGFKMTNTSVNPNNTFMAWCVDIYDDMNTGSTSYTLKSGADFYSAAQAYMATDLSRLASWVFDNNLLTSGAASAAFQLAVWEIVDDAAGHRNYDVASGDFSVTTSSSWASVLGTANDWLTVVNDGSYGIDRQLSVWQQDVAGSTQNLAVFAPVPEPGIVAMLLSGLGLMGFVARRRKRALDG